MAACCSLACECEWKRPWNQKKVEKVTFEHVMPRFQDTNGQLFLLAGIAGASCTHDSSMVQGAQLKWNLEGLGSHDLLMFTYFCWVFVKIQPCFLQLGFECRVEMSCLDGHLLYKVSGEKLGVNKQLCCYKTASWARSWSLCPVESQLRSKTIFTMFRPCQLLAQPHITPNSSHQVSPFNQSQDLQIDDFVAWIWRTHAFCSSIAPDLGNTQRRFLHLGNGTYSTHITSDWHTNYKHAAWCIYLWELDVNPWLRTINKKGDHDAIPVTWHLLHFLQQRCNEASEERRTKRTTEVVKEIRRSPSSAAELETWTLLASND